MEEKAIIADLDFQYFFDRYADRILEYAKEEFECHITNEIHLMLCECLYEGFRREDVESGAEPGIVFAGFGRKELFPVVLHCVVDGKDDGYLRHWTLSNSCDFNVTRMLRGTIIPFAQNDMTRLFLEGIFARHIRWIGRTITGLLDRKSEDIVNRYVPEAERVVELRMQKDDNAKMTDKLQVKFMDYRQETFVDPVMEVVSNLPKEDMAQMAEASVELTSLRRKVGSDVNRYRAQ